jgi:hypothetical protein
MQKDPENLKDAAGGLSTSPSGWASGGATVIGIRLSGSFRPRHIQRSLRVKKGARRRCGATRSRAVHLLSRHSDQLKSIFPFRRSFFPFDEGCVERVFLRARPMDNNPQEPRVNGAVRSLRESPCNLLICCRSACSVEPNNGSYKPYSRRLRKVAGDVSLPSKPSRTPQIRGGQPRATRSPAQSKSAFLKRPSAALIAQCRFPTF